MRTQKTVTSDFHGTLEQTNSNSIGFRMRQVAAGLLLSVLSLGVMAFSGNDTTKKTEDTGINRFTVAVVDSCCTTTFVQSAQKIVIVNRSFFNGDITINNMDLNSWVNSLMAYSFKRININAADFADNRMDVTFSAAEAKSRRLAAAYGKNMEAEVEQADETINSNFLRTVAVPAFQKELGTELSTSDVHMDAQFRNDEGNRIKVISFRSALQPQLATADASMDVEVNVQQLKPVSAKAAASADELMDTQLLKRYMPKLQPATLLLADEQIDRNFQNR